MNEFGRVCERKKFRVNLGRSKVMRCSKQVSVGRIYVSKVVNQLEEEDCSPFNRKCQPPDERCERDVLHKTDEGYKA